MAKYCTNCGAELRPGSKFCLNCGEKIDLKEDLSAAASVNDTEEKPVRKRRTTKKTAENKAEETAEPKTRKRRTTAKKAKSADEEPAGITIDAPEGAEVVVSDEAPKPAPKRRSAARKTKSADNATAGITIAAPEGAEVVISDEAPKPAPKRRTSKKKAESDDSGSKFCLKCGAPLSADSKFCLSCGEPVSSKEPVSIKESTSKKQTGTKKKKKSSSSQPAQKKSHGGAFILLMAVVLGITGFLYPGFLVDKEQPPQDWVIHGNNGNGNHGNNGSGNNGNTGGSSGSNSSGKQPASDTLLVTEPDSFQVIYTQNEVASSPEYTSSVSPENHIVSAGSTSVDFDSWNLPEEDTLIVHELPEKTDESGWEIKAYDFSLASGQDEFATEVTVTIPREADDAFMEMCLTYNEETKQWEEIPYEISEDGSTYQIYTDHFSKKARAILPWRYLDSLDIEAGTLDLQALSNEESAGIISSFYIAYKKDMPKMQQQICANYDSLKKAFRSDTLTDLNELAQFAKNDVDPGDTMTSRFCNLLGNADVSNSVIEASKLRAKLNIPVLTKLADNETYSTSLSYIGTFITLSKLMDETRKGKPIDQVIMNNIFDIAGVYITGAGVVLGAAAAPKVAAAAVAVYLISSLVSHYEDRTLEPQEDLYYRYYFQTAGGKERVRYFVFNPEGADDKWIPNATTALCDEDFKKSICRINRPASMSSEEYMELCNYAIENKYINGVFPGIDLNSKEIPLQWALLLKKVYNMYYDRPDQLPQVIEDLYKAYAYALYDLGPAYVEMFYENESYFTAYDKNADNFYPTTEQMKIYADNLASKSMAHHADLHEKLMLISEHLMFKETKRIIQDELLPLLNTKIRFRVRDASLKDPDTFYKTDESKYAVDFAKMKENKHLISGIDSDGSIIYSSTNGNLDFNTAKTPMRFAISETENGRVFRPVTEMAFYPAAKMNPRRSEDNLRKVYTETIFTSQWYYPGTECFLPRYIKDDPYVFECNYYHWLMMGAPNGMIFYDPAGKEDPIVVPFDFDQSTERAAVTKSDGTITVTLTVRSAATVYENLKLNKDDIAELAQETLYNVQDTDTEVDAVDPIPSNNTITIQGDKVTVELGKYDWNNYGHKKHDTKIGYKDNFTRDAFTVEAKIIEKEDDYIYCRITKVPDSIKGEGNSDNTVKYTDNGVVTYVEEKGYIKNKLGNIDLEYNNASLTDMSLVELYFDKGEFKRAVISLQGTVYSELYIQDRYESDSITYDEKKTVVIELVR